MALNYSRLASAERAERNRRRWLLLILAAALAVLFVVFYYAGSVAGYERGYDDGRGHLPRVHRWF